MTKLGETGLVDYLWSKGLRVVKPLQFTDIDIVKRAGLEKLDRDISDKAALK
jgi:hypothetical protein